MMSEQGPESSAPSALRSVPIAKLIPANHEATKALDDLKKSSQLSEHHAHFLEAAKREYEGEDRSSQRETNPEASSTAEDSDSSAETLWAGQFALDFSSYHVRGWAIGRGNSKFGENRGVDLILCRPGKGSKLGVAAVHALIQFHLQSGVLMLVGLSDANPIKYFLDYERAPILLRHRESHALYQKVNRFSFGKLDFKLVYEDLDEVALQNFISVRNACLEGQGGRAPHPHLHPVPQENYRMVGSSILHQNLSSGAFGWVYAAIDVRSGAPLAIKELAIKDREMAKHPDIKNELRIANSFEHEEGLLQATSIRCDHNRSGLCGKYPEHVYITLPLAKGDFGSRVWSSIDLQTVIALLRGPLQGLEALHKAGYMHKDVSSRNILVMSLDPPHAVLCDYGKARHSLREVDSRIGPIPTLAPEVDGITRYTNKIDIWGIGYVCAQILFPEYQRAKVDKSKPPSRNIPWYLGLKPLIQEFCKRGPLERSFGDLVDKMLEWEPSGRPSAAEALAHPCMRLAPLEESIEEAPVAKVAKKEHKATDKPALTTSSEMATQIASDRTQPLT